MRKAVTISERSILHPSGRSAAWLARLPWEQEVECSNHSAPTIMKPFSSASCFIFRFEFLPPLRHCYLTAGKFPVIQSGALGIRHRQYFSFSLQDREPLF